MEKYSKIQLQFKKEFKVKLDRIITILTNIVLVLHNMNVII